MPRGRVQRIQDCIHGLMEFHGVEGVIVELLRTPEVSRLRRIKQLGMAHYVFPGGEHSRFAHSLGASYLAIRFTRKLNEIAREIFAHSLCPDEMSTRDMAIAALCHDLGHGPFSHAWEREIITDNFDRDAWVSKLGLPEGKWCSKLKWHEIVGHGLLLWPDGKLFRLLEQHEEGAAMRIHNLLLGRYHVPHLPRLLGGDIDIDRADFIRRDSVMTGVGVDPFDLEWLISTCTIGELRRSNSKEWVVGFSYKAIRVIEQFLIARRALYERVYWHKTIRCVEGMMALFLRRLKMVVLDGTKVLDDRFFGPLIDVINGKPLEQIDLIKLDDSVIQLVIETVAASDIKVYIVRDLARRIVERNLFKIVPVDENALETFRSDPHWNEKLCSVIKPYVLGDPEYYFVVDYRPFTMMSKLETEQVYLIGSDRTAEAAANLSTFSSYREQQLKVQSIFTVLEAVDAVKNLIENHS